MRTKLGRLGVLAVLVMPLGIAGLNAAPAAAAEGTTCNGNTGSIKLSPGLSETAAVQNITIKGTLSECTGSTVTEASYVAHLKTTNAVTCAALSSAGEEATGSVVIKWAPKGQGNSKGTLSLPLTETPGVSLLGTVEKGPFATLGISGTASQSYPGTCGGTGTGKMKPKKIKDGTLTGSAVAIS